MLDNRRQSIDNSYIKDSTVVQVAGDMSIDKELLEKLISIKGSENTMLLNKLVSTVLKEVEKDIENDDLNVAMGKIDSILTYGLNGLEINNKEEIYYFKGFIHLKYNEQEKVKSCIDIIDHLKNYSKLSFKLKIKLSIRNENEEELKGLLLEAEKRGVSTLEINEYKLQFLLRTSQFERITNEYKTKSDIDSHLCLYIIGIAFLNQHNYEKANKYIGEAYSKKNKAEYKYGKVLVEIIPIFGKRGGPFAINDTERILLNESKEILLSIRESYNKRQHEEKLEYYEILLNTLLFIDIDKVIDIYESLPKDITDQIGIKAIMGGYYEINEQYDKALDYYETVYNETDNLSVLINIFSILFIQKRHGEIISRFNNLKGLDGEGILIGLYLRAVKAMTPENLEKEILLYEKNYKNKPLFYLIVSQLISENNENKNYMFNELLGCINYEDEHMIIEASEIAYEMNRISDAKKLLLSIEQKSMKANIKLINLLKISGTEEDIILLDKIVSREIEGGNKSELVLSAKADMLFEGGKYREAIKAFEEIFTQYPSERVVGNIVSLKIQTKSKDNLEKYLSYLQNNTKSALMLMLCARGYELIGKNKISEELAYKAICLQENIDKDTAEQYLLYYFGIIINSPDGNVEFENVIDDSVVILKNKISGNEERICINSEDLNHSDNIFIGAIQIDKNSFTYVELIGKKVNDTVTLHSEQFIVVEIINKYVYAFRYVLEVYDRYFPNSKFLRKISASNPTEFINQMVPLMKENEQHILFEKYNFKDNSLGIPIDYLIGGAYDKYHEVIYHLLYGNDCLLYAGEKNNCLDLKSRKVIVSLSTFVILNVLNKLELLDNIKKNIIIPQSLKTKVINIFREVNNLNQKSPGQFFLTDDNKPVYVENVKQSKENRINFWRKICEYISEIEAIKIQEDLVIESQVESVFNAIDICQLESIILAKQMNGIYICDDLFFRRMCLLENIHVDTTNLTSLFDLLENKEDYLKEILELSKTNYTYCVYKDNISDILKNATYSIDIIDNLFNNQKKASMYTELILEVFKNN